MSKTMKDKKYKKKSYKYLKNKKNIILKKCLINI